MNFILGFICGLVVAILFLLLDIYAETFFR